MAKTIEDLFFYLVFLFDALLILQISLLTRLRQSSNRILLVIACYCFLNTICNFGQEHVTIIKKAEYLTLTLFTLLECLAFTYIFYYLTNRKSFKRVIVTLTIIFIGIVAFNYSYDNKHRIDSLPIGVETLLILVYCFHYMFEQTNIVDDTFIYSRYHFWIVIGIMIYLSGSFFIYILANYVNLNILDDFWFLTYAFYILKSIFFGIGILRLSRLKKENNLTAFRPYLN